MLEEGLASSVTDALDQPFDLTMRIMELRAYARANDLVERAQKNEDLPKDPMIDLVFAVREELAKIDRERRRK